MLFIVVDNQSNEALGTGVTMCKLSSSNMENTVRTISDNVLEHNLKYNLTVSVILQTLRSQIRWIVFIGKKILEDAHYTYTCKRSVFLALFTDNVAMSEKGYM